MNRVTCRIVLTTLLVAALCAAVAAQEERRNPTNSPSRRSPAPPSTTQAALSAQENAGANVDENFELNINERRITERDFFASTAIETSGDSVHGLSLRIGVALGANEIDVLLRNVQGRVRFRGSLAALRRVLDARRPLTPELPTAQPSVP